MINYKTNSNIKILIIKIKCINKILNNIIHNN